ncbi:MAG: methylmalonyl Co-A mutase-associated GTPase MeaB [Arenicellales bacterium]
MNAASEHSLRIQTLANSVLAGDRRALSKAITLVESAQPLDRALALNLLDIIMPYTGKAKRIALSGSPGVGKSTFIEAFGQFLIEQGETIAVLAIDPSSKRTGGSILGDKTRMPTLANNPKAYIRPTPSGNLLGGVARRSREVIALCEAAGYSTLLIETVGVGQSETDVSEMTDCSILLLQPASGDALQGIKRGIMEMADIVIINKADGDLLPAARHSAAHYLQSLALMPKRMPDWACPVLLCSALEKTGLDALHEKIREYFVLAKENTYFSKKRSEQLSTWLEDETLAELISAFKAQPELQAQYQALQQSLASGVSPARLAVEFARKIIAPTQP